MITFLRAVCWAFLVLTCLVAIQHQLVKRDSWESLRWTLERRKPEMAGWVWPAFVVAILFLWNVQP